MGDTAGLDYHRAVQTARNAADAAYANYGPDAFTWLEALEGASSHKLARYLVANRYATAAQLYQYAVRAPDAARYADIPLALKIGIEVFRSSFLALVAMVEVPRIAHETPLVSGLVVVDRPVADWRDTPRQNAQRQRAIAEFQRSAPVAIVDERAAAYERALEQDDGRPKKRGKR